VHCPPSEHVDPLDTQSVVFESQQAPPLQLFPAQHGCPGPPHAVHTSFAEHDVPVPVHVRPAQHGCPGPPHCAQVPF